MSKTACFYSRGKDFWKRNVLKLVRKRGGAKQSQTRVGFVSHSAECYGAEKALLELIDGLTQQHVGCCVLLPETGPLEKELQARGVSCAIIPYKWWADPPAFRLPLRARFVRMLFNMGVGLLIAFYLLLWKIDIIYTNTAVIPSGALAATLLRKPHIWHVHEFVEDGQELSFNLGPHWTLKTIFFLSTFVIANSKALQAQLTQYSKRGDQLLLIAPGLHDPLRSTCMDMTGEQTPRPQRIFQMAIIGRVSEYKGQIDAIRALAALASEGMELSLTIVGDEDPNYIHYLHGYIQTHGIKHRVHFTGYLENPMLVMKAADVVLVCSRSETFGRVTIEAMRLGKPVIGTRSGATPELIQENFNGLLYTRGDVRELKQKVKYLMSSPAFATTMGRNAQRWAEEQFTMERYVDQVVGVLHKAIQKDTTSAP